MLSVLCAVLSLTALTACTGSHAKKRATPRVTTTSSTSTTGSPAPTLVGGPESAPCRTTGLAISADGELGALGHGGVVVHLRNTGPSKCRLTGYPGVAALDDAGRQAAQAERTPSGYIGGLSIDHTTPPVVDVGPGDTASALVETTHVRVNDTAPCPQYSGMLVTPPGETHAVRLTVGFSGCTIQVHPVLPGDTGSETR